MACELCVCVYIQKAEAETERLQAEIELNGEDSGSFATFVSDSKGRDEHERTRLSELVSYCQPLPPLRFPPLPLSLVLTRTPMCGQRDQLTAIAEQREDNISTEMSLTNTLKEKVQATRDSARKYLALKGVHKERLGFLGDNNKIDRRKQQCLTLASPAAPPARPHTHHQHRTTRAGTTARHQRHTDRAIECSQRSLESL